MRSTCIAFHNNQQIELFAEKHHDAFEVWVIGPVKGVRMVLDHFLTHDDLERYLEYARAGDLVWRNTLHSEIPKEIHLVAKEAASIVKRGKFTDFLNKERQSLAYHVWGTINVPSLDRKAWNVAKKAILGRWSDGIATLEFGSNSQLKWSCPLDQPHPLNLGARGGYEPDWWSFSGWQLHIMNDEHRSGMRIAVLQVNDQELHICCENHPRRLAHILGRANVSASDVASGSAPETPPVTPKPPRKYRSNLDI